MFFALALALPLLQDSAPEWGGFRGNNGTGVAREARVPAALDPEGNAAWRVEIPSGYSSPVVAGGRVFVTGAEGAQLLTLALDLETGEEVWRREVEFDGQRVGMNSSAAPSPATDGERLYTLFHAVGLITYDLDGEELWRQEIGPFNIPHGMSSSPVVHDGVVVQLVDQDLEAYVAAFDAATGEELWTAERPGPHGYSTPAIYSPEGGSPQVVVSGAFQIRAYDLASGERHQITSDLDNYAGVAVTSDGKTISALRNSGGGTLWVGGLDDPAAARQLTSDPTEGVSALRTMEDGTLFFIASAKPRAVRSSSSAERTRMRSRTSSG